MSNNPNNNPKTFGGKGSKGPNVFSQGAFNKGLQQYFTPQEWAEFIVKAFEHFSNRRGFRLPPLVIDPTCGNGALLEPWTIRGYFTIGIEIDPDMAREARKRASVVINGDVREVLPALTKYIAKIPAIIVANPPYGLRFEIYPNGAMQSDMAIFKWFQTVIGYANNPMAFVLPADSPVFKDTGPWLKFHIPDPWGLQSHQRDIVIALKANYIGADYAVQNAQEAVEVVRGIDKRAAYLPWVDWSVRERFEEQKKELKELAKQDLVSPKLVVKDGKVYFVGSRLAILHHTERVSVADFERYEKGIDIKLLAANASFARELQNFAQKAGLKLPAEYLKELDRALIEYHKSSAPLQPLYPHQQIAYLVEAHTVKCLKDGTIEGCRFKAGQTYMIRAAGLETVKEERERKTHKIDYTERTTIKYITYYTAYIDIEGEDGQIWRFRDDQEKAIQFLIDHFKMPWPGTAEENETQAYKANLQKLETFKYPEGQELLQFQKEDIARLALRNRGLLSWDTGLGKTRAMIYWAKLRGSKKILIVSPARSILNMAEEIRKAAGMNPVIIKTMAQASKAVRSESGLYLISYNLLATALYKTQEADIVNGTITTTWKNGTTTTYTSKALTSYKVIKYHNGYSYNSFIAKTRDFYAGGRHQVIFVDTEKTRPMKWKATYYPVAEILRRGRWHAVILDEGHYIKGDSNRRKAAFKINAPNKLIATATPIKNIISDFYYPLLWLFAGNPAFAYTPGKDKYGSRESLNKVRERFTEHFGVIEHTVTKIGSTTQGRRKKVIDVRNLSSLWKLITPFMIRRTKEKLAEEYSQDYERINGGQRKPLKIDVHAWPATPEFIKGYERIKTEFLDAFQASHETQFEGQIEALMRSGGQDILGRLIYLQQFCSCPSNPNLEYAPGYDWRLNIDPKDPKEHMINRVINRITQAVQNGEKVILFTQFYGTQDFYKEALEALGLKVAVINGKRTKKQNEAVRQAFAAGQYDILVAATGAAGLGLNGLHVASLAIFVDLMWDPTTFRQAIGRIYRIGQKKQPKVEVHFVAGSVAAHIWNQVYKKGKQADLVIDGTLTELSIPEKSVIQIVAEKTNETTPTLATVPVPELIKPNKPTATEPTTPQPTTPRPTRKVKRKTKKITPPGSAVVQDLWASVL